MYQKSQSCQQCQTIEQSMATSSHTIVTDVFRALNVATLNCFNTVCFYGPLNGAICYLVVKSCIRLKVENEIIKFTPNPICAYKSHLKVLIKRRQDGMNQVVLKMRNPCQFHPSPSQPNGISYRRSHRKV